jgi:hypothetical protein
MQLRRIGGSEVHGHEALQKQCFFNAKRALCPYKTCAECSLFDSV